MTDIAPRELADEGRQHIEEIARQCFEREPRMGPTLTPRQFDIWNYDRKGMSIYAIREELLPPASARTIYRELQRAREIIATALLEEREGKVRFGVTVAHGRETHFASDPVLSEAAWSSQR
jgi:hypothetical protein